jgi:hypothetical protein
MPQSIGFLEAQGFHHVLNDEPYEDHWLLEGLPGGVSFLVENETAGWSVARDPRGDERPGEWYALGTGLSPEAMMTLLRKELTAIGLDVI